MKNLRIAFALALAAPLGACAHMTDQQAPSAAATAHDPRVEDATRAWCSFYQRHFAGTCTPAQRAELSRLIAADMAAAARPETFDEQDARRASLKTAIAAVLGMTAEQMDAPFRPRHPAGTRPS